jgi:hypothetical protein
MIAQMRVLVSIAIASFLAGLARGGERTQNFDSDLRWEGINNRTSGKKAKNITQDFGFSASNFAGRNCGEIGGLVTRASEPAYYAAKIAAKTLNDPLTASGTFALTQSSGGSGMFFGFFRAAQPGASGRPLSSLGLDLDCEKGGGRLAVRLITASNQSCGTFVTPFIPGKFRPTPIRNNGTRYTWKLDYDPQGANGLGRFTFNFHGERPRPGELETPDMPEGYRHEAHIRFPSTTAFSVDLPKGFKQQGTTFDHFGMMNMMKPGGRLKIYFDDLQFPDRAEDFSKDPNWDGVGNRVMYQTTEVAGAQNFGFSNTHFAGGQKPGELGGIFWRSEGRVASCADDVGPLTLSNKLAAHGKVALVAAAPDSGMFIGWFNSKTVDQKNGLRDFVGVRIEGPTRVGHYFAPVVASGQGLLGKLAKAPVLVPDKKPHDWSIQYDPKANGGNGTLLVHLDNESAVLNLHPRNRDDGHFDRFGVFTPRVGGSQVKIYFDDLAYTASPQ